MYPRIDRAHLEGRVQLLEFSLVGLGGREDRIVERAQPVHRRRIGLDVGFALGTDLIVQLADRPLRLAHGGDRLGAVGGDLHGEDEVVHLSASPRRPRVLRLP